MRERDRQTDRQRERERERDRDRDRQTDRDRERDRDRQTDRDGDTQRQRENESGKRLNCCTVPSSGHISVIVIFNTVNSCGQRKRSRDPVGPMGALIQSGRNCLAIDIVKSSQGITGAIPQRS